MGRIFAGGNSWWLQCCLLLAIFPNRCVFASCNRSDIRSAFSSKCRLFTYYVFFVQL